MLIFDAMKVSELKANPKNPRVLKDDKFKKLVKSIQEFPKMMSLRPMVIDTDNIILGGNMRLRAIQHIGMKEVPDSWVKRADELTEDEKQRFVIADNVGFGEWDWEALSDWDSEQLEEWGLDLPEFDNIDYSGKNKEIDTDEFSDKMIMSFEFSSDEYQFILSELSKHDANKEIAILKLLGYES